MNDFVNRILVAYRPLYLRGLMMDGHYRLPSTPEQKPQKGNRVVQLAPAFAPEQKRMLSRPAIATQSFCMAVPHEPSNGTGKA